MGGFDDGDRLVNLSAGSGGGVQGSLWVVCLERGNDGIESSRGVA